MCPKGKKIAFHHLKTADQLVFILDMFFSPTGALKSYLRELPEPLMTTELYDEWIQASKWVPVLSLKKKWVLDYPTGYDKE